MKTTSLPALCLFALTMAAPVTALAEFRGTADPVKPVLSAPSQPSGEPLPAGRDVSGMRHTGTVGPLTNGSDRFNRIESDHRTLMVHDIDVTEPARRADGRVQGNAAGMASSACENTGVNTVIQRSSARSVQGGSRRQARPGGWIENRMAAGPGNPAPRDVLSQPCHHPF